MTGGPITWDSFTDFALGRTAHPGANAPDRDDVWADGESPMTGTPPLVGTGGVGLLGGVRGAVAGAAGLVSQNAVVSDGVPTPDEVLNANVIRTLTGDDPSGDGPLSNFDVKLSTVLSFGFVLAIIVAIGQLFTFTFHVGDGE